MKRRDIWKYYAIRSEDDERYAQRVLRGGHTVKRLYKDSVATLSYIGAGRFVVTWYNGTERKAGGRKASSALQFDHWPEAWRAFNFGEVIRDDSLHYDPKQDAYVKGVRS